MLCTLANFLADNGRPDKWEMCIKPYYTWGMNE